MKTKEELNALKEEINAVNEKLAELNEEELEQVVGGQKTMPFIILGKEQGRPAVQSGILNPIKKGEDETNNMGEKNDLVPIPY